MKYVEFTEREKVEMFDKIAERFYNANFGQTSKADIELIMFDFFIRKLIRDNQNADGTIDYRTCSDYIISKELGITQQRVRNLKVKNQLVHPIEYDWKAALATLTQNARYESNSRKITINIPDPNLYYEIQNFIEEQGGYVEIQLNSKLLQIRVEYFIELIIALEPESNRYEVIKALKDAINKSGKKNCVLDEKHIGKFLIESGVNILPVLEKLVPKLSTASTIATALLSLINSVMTSL